MREKILSLKLKNPARRETLLALALPFALVLVLTMAVLSVFDFGLGFNRVTFLTALMLIPVFAVCRFTEKHKVIGGLLVTGGLALSGRLLSGLLIDGWYETYTPFQEWLLTAGSEIDSAVSYEKALWFGCVVFFGTTVYYFAKVLYRTSFLMLLSLLPCVLYAKVMNDIDNLYLILIATLNVAVFLSVRAGKREKSAVYGRWAMAAAAGVYIFVLFLAASAIPKEKEARYYDRFEDLFLGGNTHTEVDDDFSTLGSVSGDADFFGRGVNRRLYYLYGEAFVYLKRQNFDYYDFRRDRWVADKETESTKLLPAQWEQEHRSLSYSKLQSAIRKGEQYEPGFAKRYGLEGLLEGETVSDPIRTLQISAENFGAVYYLVPTRIVSVQSSDEAPFYATLCGTFRREEGMHPKDHRMELAFYDDVTAAPEWIRRGGGNLDMETALAMLSDLYGILDKHQDEDAQTAADWYREHLAAAQYGRECAENTAQISDALRELALELTKDLTYDWEKASALQEFFQGREFSYDITYRAEDDSPEYFVFESQTGTCSDYASAYTLMARSIGLSVRYAEGFVPEFTGREKEYYVKESTSHAYPEVFLPCMGWTVFEPTSARVIPHNTAADGSLSAFLSRLKVDVGLMGTVLLAGAAVAVTVLLIRILLPLLLELWFRLRICFLAPGSCLTQIYKRTVRKLSAKKIPGASYLTPRELAQYLLNEGTDIRTMTEPLQAYLYGGISPTKEEKNAAIHLYFDTFSVFGGRIRHNRKK